MTAKTILTISIKTELLNKIRKARNIKDISEFIEQAILEDLDRHGE